MAAPVISPQTFTAVRIISNGCLYYQYQTDSFQRKAYGAQHHGQHHQSGQRDSGGTDGRPSKLVRITITCCPRDKSMPYTCAINMAVTHSNNAVPFMFYRIAQGQGESGNLARYAGPFPGCLSGPMGNEAADEAVVKAVNRSRSHHFHEYKRVSCVVSSLKQSRYGKQSVQDASSGDDGRVDAQTSKERTQSLCIAGLLPYHVGYYSKQAKGCQSG